MSWDSKLFQRYLTTRRFGRQIRYFPEIDSTNSWLAENWSEFTLSGSLVIAEHQTSGRGRFKRQWDDVPQKSLLFSVLLISTGDPSITGFDQMLPAISLVRALHRRLSSEHEVRLKWPNDIMLNDRKLAGILAERFLMGERVITIVGMGINVNTYLRELSEPARQIGTSLLAETGVEWERERLLAEILNEWEPLYDALRAGDTGAIRGAWSEYGPPAGTPIVRNEQNSTLSGVFEGIGDYGQLMLRDAEGKMHEFYSGDISQ
jgi:BirA family transcriptional regulator, biotin operon repressor / biotin---[acetyl-CoA-carboxylase] ligase